MKRVSSSRNKVSKSPAPAAVAKSDDEPQVGGSEEILVDTQLNAGSRKKATSSKPTIKIVTSSKLRAPIIDNLTKSQIKGAEMFNLVERFLLQEIGGENT